MLDGRNIDVQATGVRARGGFRYLQPQDDEPWLGILAGISTNDGGQAWRYFPENLMGKELVDYLSGAIKGGQPTRPWFTAVIRTCSPICITKASSRFLCH